MYCELRIMLYCRLKINHNFSPLRTILAGTILRLGLAMVESKVETLTPATRRNL